MLDITNEHLRKFREIKTQFFSKTEVPTENNWTRWTNNDIWLHLIKQVIVVGGSAPADKFDENEQLKERVSFEKLAPIENKAELKRIINQTLRAVGTRYASSNIVKCRKTNALAHNFRILKNFQDGPRKYLMKILHFIQSKSARDYLMELGLVKNAIALDTRVQNVLYYVGITIPKGFDNDPKLYDEIENDILMKICKPIELTGVEFDRMLYQNYKNILCHKFE